MADISPSVFVFCALVCEARPLIDGWKLQKLPLAGRSFAIYANSERVVVVTGIGKVNMAGAVGYALALFNAPESPILINLGIAGHRSAEVGSIYLAQKIIDAETGRRHYPQMPFAVPCPALSVETLSLPRTDYKHEELYEMEAAGFYELAIKFGSGELVQVVKIVSDNVRSSIDAINEASVEDWVTRQLVIIDELIARLMLLRQSLPFAMESWYRELAGEFRFSVSNSLKLKALLQRWRLIKGRDEIAWRAANIRSAKELLVWLEREIDRTEFYL